MGSREYHYVITVQYQNPDGYGVMASTRSGVVEVDPGDTRESVFDEAVQRVRRELGVDASVTLFFALEPNELGAQDG